MRPVYLKDFNDINWMNVGLNKNGDYYMANYAGKIFAISIWKLVSDIQVSAGIEPTENFDDFWENNMSRIEFHEEMGWIGK